MKMGSTTTNPLHQNLRPTLGQSTAVLHRRRAAPENSEEQELLSQWNGPKAIRSGLKKTLYRPWLPGMETMPSNSPTRTPLRRSDLHWLHKLWSSRALGYFFLIIECKAYNTCLHSYHATLAHSKPSKHFMLHLLCRLRFLPLRRKSANEELKW